jgi:hypothetical protein
MAIGTKKQTVTGRRQAARFTTSAIYVFPHLWRFQMRCGKGERALDPGPN